MAEIWGAVIIGGAAIAGGAISAAGAKSAAGQQASAAENAAQVSQNEFNTITGQEQPYMQAGQGALSALNYGLGIGSNAPGGGGGTGMGYGSLLSPFTAQNFQQLSPAYQFQLQQGRQGVLNSDSSGQGALSGAALKDLTGYNQNLANTSFNNAFNQYQTQQGNIYSRLSNLANLGQNAATNTGQQGTQLAGQIAQSTQNIGTALAGGTVGAANAIGGTLGSLGGLYAAYGGGGGSSSQTPSYTSQYSGGYDPGSGPVDFVSSDRRLKQEIRRLGSTEGGQPWYEFEYIANPGVKHTGVMADESPPQAVIYDEAGFALVDYSKIK